MPKSHIAVLIMCKNEKKRIHITLESVKNIADSLVIFDTGSTDNTLDIIRDFSDKNKIPLHIKQGEFIDFSTSRNESIEFAETFLNIDYLLMLDVNDELRGWQELRKYADENINEDISAYLVNQEWWNGNVNKYFNIRFIRPRKSWRYTGVVHEYIKGDEIEDPKKTRLPENIILYQDRTLDDDKTGKRFVRDEILLKKEYIKDPTEPRTVFYLAQTYSCLNDIESSYYYYKIRTTLVGFFEERFESCLKCGDFAIKLKLDWYESFTWYMKAFELIPRVEPLLKIGEYHITSQNWILAHTYLSLACRLKYPDFCILFIDALAYDYKRWHLLGIVSYYVGNISEGKAACITAIENGKKRGFNVDRDIENLKIYEEKEKEIVETNTQPQQPQQPQQQINTKIMTKNQFISIKIEELRKEKSKLSEKQLQQHAKLLWKLQNKNL